MICKAGIGALPWLSQNPEMGVVSKAKAAEV
jgi:hypothetical protein